MVDAAQSWQVQTPSNPVTIQAHIPALVYRLADKRALAGGPEVQFPRAAPQWGFVKTTGKVALWPALTGGIDLRALQELARAGDHVPPLTSPISPPLMGPITQPFITRLVLEGGVLSASPTKQNGMNLLWGFKDPKSGLPSPKPMAGKTVPDEAVLTFERAHADDITVEAQGVSLTLKHPGPGKTLRIDFKNLPERNIIGPWGNTVQSPIWHWDVFYRLFDPQPKADASKPQRPLPYRTDADPPGGDAPRCPPSQFP